MRRSLNLKFIALLFVGLVFTGGGVHFLHAFQLRRNAYSLMEYAKKAEENKDFSKSIFYLRRYLGFNPTDTEALLKLALLSADHAEKLGSPKQAAGAYFLLNSVLLRDEKNQQARRRIIDLAVKIGRYADAREHIKKFVAYSPNDFPEKAELEYLTGVCLKRESKFSEAVEKLKEAEKLDPKKLEVYEQLAFLYRYRLEDPNSADDVMKRMVAANRNSLEAHLASATYFLANAKRDNLKKGAENGSLKQATKGVNEAQALAPKDARVLLLSGRLLLLQAANAKADKDSKTQREKLEEARALFKKGIAEHPKNPEMYVALADLEARDGDPDEGLKILKKGLGVVTSKVEVLNQLIDLLIQKRELVEALEVIDRLRDEKQADPLVNYQQARLFAAKNEWGKAGDLLNKIRRDDRLLELPALVKNLDLLRGLCFEKLGNPDQALLAYQDVVKYDPLFIPGRIRLATAYLNLDRLSEAINEFTRIADFRDAPAATPLALARLLMLQNLRLAPKERNWQAVKDRLAEANRISELKDEVEVVLLQADALLLEDAGQVEKARKLLLDRRAAKPDQVELWIALAVLSGRDQDKKVQEKIDNALRILDEAAKRPTLQNRPELTMARMRYLAQNPDAAEAKKALAGLEKTVLAAEGEDRKRLLAGLGNAYYLAGDRAAAGRFWQLLSKENPANLGIRLLLFDLSLVTEKYADCREFLKEIRALEGQSGSYWRYGEASLLLAKAKPKEGETPTAEALQSLIPARQYLTEVVKLRPSWFRVPALEGLIDDLNHRPEKAIDDFQEAIRLGDRRPVIIRKLVDLLFARGRMDDVEKAIRKLLDQEQALVSAGLGKLATESLLRVNDVERALKIANDSVDSKDFKDHLWLGRVLYAVGKFKQAEEELTEACRLAPNHPDPWKARVLLLVNMDKKEEAEKLIAEATKKLPSEDAPLALAHCHDALGNQDLAEKFFTAALKNKPHDLVTIENVAAFYSRHGIQDKAASYWQKILDRQAEPELHRRARRHLAMALGLSNDYKSFQDALQLLERNLRDEKKERSDLLAKGLLFAVWPSYRRESMRILEDMDRLETPHRFTLAQLYAAADNWPKVQFHMRVLLGSGNKLPANYYAFYITHLLARKEMRHTERIQQAENLLASLEKQDANGVGALEIKARILQAKGKNEAALAILKSLAQRKEVDLGRLAGFVDELGQIPKDKSKEPYARLAEEFFRRKISQAGDQPNLLALAHFLGKNQRLPEALDYCEQAMAKGSAKSPITLALGLLRLSQPEDKLVQRVEGWLQNKLQDNPNDKLLLQAELHDLQGRYEAAISLYRRILQHNPNNVLALNNLAWLLAHQGQAAKALELMETALAVAGPRPGLLDTRGIIFLAMDKNKESVKDLQDCVAMAGTPTRFYHLARAYFRDKKYREAALQLEKAQDKGFKIALLHPLERQFYQPLVDTLSKRK
jgi:tetratricopeptide (TPR) repeat protein